MPRSTKRAAKAASVGAKTVRRDAGAVSEVSTSAHCVCDAAVTRVFRPLSPAMIARLASMSMAALILCAMPLAAATLVISTVAEPPTAGETVSTSAAHPSTTGVSLIHEERAVGMRAVPGRAREAHLWCCRTWQGS
eukprot:scaffold140287_cov130-Phaeocystis_antarctica.AAC.1